LLLLHPTHARKRTVMAQSDFIIPSRPLVDYPTRIPTSYGGY
jgi:hypothetical protein